MPRVSGFAIAAFLSAVSLTALSASVAASESRVLYSFCHHGKSVCADGKNPAANLVADAAGNLYGTTNAGGSTGDGVVFELVRSGRKHSYQLLHSFDGAAEGGVPVTPLIIDTAGNLYGTATADGANFGGTAFKLSPNGGQWTYTVLTSFCSTADDGCIQGQVPESPLTYAGESSGQPYDGTSTLYGTTLERGACTPAQKGSATREKHFSIIFGADVRSGCGHEADYCQLAQNPRRGAHRNG
jgi:uncharacterized repeat protein (TIGR03803 family)